MQDYNGGSGGGGRSSSSERGGSSSLEAKKAKLDEYLPPQQQMSSEDSYRLLLYQTWAAASAAGKTNSASAASNPAAAAAAAAWSSHYAQAIKVNYAGYCIIDREPNTVFKNHSKCLISFFFVHLKWKNCSHCSQYWMRLFLWFSNTVEPQSSGISFHSSSGWWPKFKVWIFHLFPGWQGANGTPCWLFHASPEAVLIYGPQWRQLPPKLRGQNDFAFASSQQWLQTTCQIQSYVRSRRIALWEAGAK